MISEDFLRHSHSQQENHWAEGLDEIRLGSNDGNFLMETPCENKREIRGENNLLVHRKETTEISQHGCELDVQLQKKGH